MKFAAKAISDGCLCFCFRSYRWIFYGIRIIPIYIKNRLEFLGLQPIADYFKCDALCVGNRICAGD